MSLPNPAPVQFRDLISTVCTLTAVAQTPGAVAAGTTVTAAVTVTGAALGDRVDVTCQSSLGNVLLQGEVTAANTVTLKWANVTAGSITPPAAALYNIVVYQRNPVLFV